MKDLIEAFSDPKILSSLVLIKVKDNNGRMEAGEGTSFLIDVLTEFWFRFFQSLAIGATPKVPCSYSPRLSKTGTGMESHREASSIRL